MSDTVREAGRKPRLLTRGEQELLERVRARRVLPVADERRRIRTAAHVTQRELARALGVSWTAIQRWEAGSRPRQREHEIRYAEMLGELARLGAEGGGPD